MLVIVKGALVAIVDDDEGLCCSLVDVMRAFSYRAEPFPSAETFLASADLLHFDCIVADVQMPGMSGLDLARVLADQGCSIPVILITALPDLHLEDMAAIAGARWLVRKPFETNTLLDCIESTLQ